MWRLLGLLALAACAPTGLGADPTEEDAIDTDGDGLSDAEEASRGTDPEVVDSDGDGYGDGDEVVAHSDPTDADSRIYVGGWPFRSDKNELEAGDWRARPLTGTPVPRIVGEDQFGDLVDLYDFYGDVPVVLDLTGVWCGICWEQAEWLGGRANDWYDWEWPGVPEMVFRGQIRWITVMVEGEDGQPADGLDCRQWAAAFPHPRVPVIEDHHEQLADWLHLTGFPTLVLLDEELRIDLYPRSGGYGEVLDELARRAAQ